MELLQWAGATLTWSATNGLQFSVCTGGLPVRCERRSGRIFQLVTPTATGQSTITIALAPASYSPPQSQQATVVGTSSTLDLVALTPTRWVGQGATLAVPLTVEALDLGVPKANGSSISPSPRGRLRFDGQRVENECQALSPLAAVKRSRPLG